MKIFSKTALCSILFFSLTVSGVSAQQTEEQRAALERQQREQEVMQRRIEQMRGDQTPPRQIPPGSYAVKKNSGATTYLPLNLAVAIPLSAEDQAKLTPAKEDFELYKNFLKKSGTGLAKIFPDPECGSEFVLDLENSKCAAALSIPGRGAFFSFRVKKNFPFPYADIHFENGFFKAGGKSELGIISSLGDIEIEKIDLSSPEISAIRKFSPAKTEKEIRKQEEQINRGFSVNDFSFSNKTPVKTDKTYIVRTIAFRHYEQYFNDRRADILVAFRIIKQDTDGALTIVWRMLEKKASPRVYK